MAEVEITEDEAEWGALQALSFRGRNADKKRRAVIAYANGFLAGQSITETFTADDAPCNRETFHRWKAKDAQFAQAIEQIQAEVQAVTDKEAIESIRRAASKLALIADEAVDRMHDLLYSSDQNVALKAAIAILDRAGLETAAKTSSTAEVTHVVTADTFAEFIKEAERRRRS